MQDDPLTGTRAGPNLRLGRTRVSTRHGAWSPFRLGAADELCRGALTGRLTLVAESWLVEAELQTPRLSA